MPDLETLSREVQACEQQRNAQKATLNWQFTQYRGQSKTQAIVSCNFPIIINVVDYYFPQRLGFGNHNLMPTMLMIPNPPRTTQS